ncbi:hypothetical protein [Dasineura jujubifolia toursvirus 2a]|nr:hypothetical protein [Dasineura jujubifolia toursvirus 2a]
MNNTDDNSQIDIITNQVKCINITKEQYKIILDDSKIEILIEDNEIFQEIWNNFCVIENKISLENETKCVMEAFYLSIYSDMDTNELNEFWKYLEDVSRKYNIKNNIICCTNSESYSKIKNYLMGGMYKPNVVNKNFM